MRFRIFQVDAFTDRPFRGNPAAVCPLDAWPEDGVLQAVAAENRLSETAFLVPRDDRFELRWFTPESEVDLCGHATLAAGFVVLRHMDGGRREVVFETASGPLAVRRDGDLLSMDFPAVPPEPCPEPPDGLAAGLGRPPESVHRAKDWLAVYPTAEDVKGLEPDMSLLERLDLRGVVATAPTEAAARRAGGRSRDAAAPDFVSRFFAPGLGVPEDPVTGSAHCTLAPYWSRRLERGELLGRQVSRRGGEVRCEVRGERVVLAGGAVLYMEGRVSL